MRTRSEIRRQIKHFQEGCVSSDAEKETWIRALTWCLGDEEHQRRYDAYLGILETGIRLTNTMLNDVVLLLKDPER